MCGFFFSFRWLSVFVCFQVRRSGRPTCGPRCCLSLWRRCSVSSSPCVPPPPTCPSSTWPSSCRCSTVPSSMEATPPSSVWREYHTHNHTHTHTHTIPDRFMSVMKDTSSNLLLSADSLLKSLVKVNLKSFFSSDAVLRQMFLFLITKEVLYLAEELFYMPIERQRAYNANIALGYSLRPESIPCPAHNIWLSQTECQIHFLSPRLQGHNSRSKFQQGPFLGGGGVIISNLL